MTDIRLGVLDADGLVVNVIKAPESSDLTVLADELKVVALTALACDVGDRLVDGVIVPAEKPAKPERPKFSMTPVRTIPKRIVIERLIAAGKIDAAYAALQSDPAAFAKWFAPGYEHVKVDDPAALALLAAIGADADAIMAPE